MDGILLLPYRAKCSPSPARTAAYWFPISLRSASFYGLLGGHCRGMLPTRSGAAYTTQNLKRGKASRGLASFSDWQLALPKQINVIFFIFIRVILLLSCNDCFIINSLIRLLTTINECNETTSRLSETFWSIGDRVCAIDFIEPYSSLKNQHFDLFLVNFGPFSTPQNTPKIPQKCPKWKPCPL